MKQSLRNALIWKIENNLVPVALGLLVLLGIGLAFNPVHQVQAQGPSGVQQTATMLNAATKIANANPGVNNQATATLTPSGSNYAYITAIDLGVCQDGTATVNTNQNFTTTNITGAPVFSESLAATANLCAPVHTITFATPLKSTTAGTAVTVVSPSAKADTAFTINVVWYEAP